MSEIEKRKRGGPAKRTPELETEICERLSEGEPLRQICRDAHMPNFTCVYDWMHADPDFSQRIARAREKGEEAIAQECMAIADTPLIGEEITRKADGGIEVKQVDMLGHRKLQIWTRLQLLAKWNPRRWGDKTELTGPNGGPIQIVAAATDERL